jgi:hypothetical protein
MTKRQEIAKAPAPLEEYCEHFDPFFGWSNQRESFRQHLEGLLLPSEQNKTLTGLVRCVVKICIILLDHSSSSRFRAHRDAFTGHNSR